MNNNPIDFSKRSRRAILIFTCLLLIIVLIPRFYFMLSEPEKFTFYQTDLQKADFEKFEYKKKEYFLKHQKTSRFSTPISKFNPNEYTVEDWMAVGMSKKQADIILKYGRHGFYSHEDLRKVFVISDDFFKVIRDSIYYLPKPLTEKKSPEIRSVAIVELNTATVEELMKLKNIGPFFAEHIVKRREALGGFINEEQLLEIWKFDKEKLEGIKPYILIDHHRINKININTASAEELKTHPYISWNVANSIVKLRAQIGSFKRPEDMKISVLINEVLFEKLKPYITID